MFFSKLIGSLVYVLSSARPCADSIVRRVAIDSPTTTNLIFIMVLLSYAEFALCPEPSCTGNGASSSSTVVSRQYVTQNRGSRLLGGVAY
jgi:hypothetical protein